MVKALYVDFDGTLTTDKYWRSLPVDQNQKVQELLFGADRSLVGDWMRGQYSAEEVNHYVSDKLAIPYDYLWDIFVNDCKAMAVSGELLETLRLLKDSYTLVLMTGNMDSFTRFTVPSLSLENYFHHISNSFYEQLHKTDKNGELFKLFAKKTGISLSDSLLIDDNTKCCEYFAKLGGEVYQTKSPTDTLNFLKRL